MAKSFCVIGMGRFGMRIAEELHLAEHDVLVIDRDDAKVQLMRDKSRYAVCTDATVEASLRDLGVRDYDVAIVALGDTNVEQSILIAMILQQLEVPLVVARAANLKHGEALERIGVERVVYPEEESARRLAHVGFNRGTLEYMEVMPETGISMVLLPGYMRDKTLLEAGIVGEDHENSLTVFALKRNRNMILHPANDEVLKDGDVLVVAGPSERVARLFDTSNRPRQRETADQGR